MDDYRTYRLGKLTTPQTGVVFCLLATALVLYVGFQIATGHVYTKSGELTLSSPLAWCFLAIETVASVVGFRRGLFMIGS